MELVGEESTIGRRLMLHKVGGKAVGLDMVVVVVVDQVHDVFVDDATVAVAAVVASSAVAGRFMIVHVKNGHVWLI